MDIWTMNKDHQHSSVEDGLSRFDDPKGDHQPSYEVKHYGGMKCLRRGRASHSTCVAHKADNVGTQVAS